MKTSLDLADPLFHAAKALAAQRQTTLRALVEEGLRLVMQKTQSGDVQAFKLRDERFDGQQANWPEAQEWRDLESQDLVAAMNLPEMQKSEKQASKPR